MEGDSTMKLHIENIQHRRNGVCGAPFHVLLFRDPDVGRMVGIVLAQENHVAVFNLEQLALGIIEFGVNSWRGDRYEPHLRKAIVDEERDLEANANGAAEVSHGQ